MTTAVAATPVCMISVMTAWYIEGLNRMISIVTTPRSQVMNPTHLIRERGKE